MIEQVAFSCRKRLLPIFGWMVIAIAAAIGISYTPTSGAQAPTATQTASTVGKLEFEIASVRQNKSGKASSSNVPLGPGDVYVPTGGHFKATNLPLVTYIAFAYKIMGSQTQFLLRQLPRWASEDRFDIEARTEGEPTKDQMRQMMRSLLADRFKLVVHTQSEQIPVFALEPVKLGETGPHLRRHAASDPSCLNTPPPVPTPVSTAASSPRVAEEFPAICGGIYDMPPSAPGRMRFGARNVSMGLIANSLPTREVGRPVVDRTGMSGNYDFALEWTPEPNNSLPADASPPDETGAGFLQALKEQLGLKLESTKAPVDRFVIDHVEMPSEN